MLRVLIVRSLVGVLVLFALSGALFALLALLPGDPVEMFVLSNPRVRAEDVARIKKLRGLDRGVVERYRRWLLGYHDAYAPPALRPLPVVERVLRPGERAQVSIPLSALVFDDGTQERVSAYTIVPLFGARLVDDSLTLTLDEPGHTALWFVVRAPSGLEAVGRAPIHARLDVADARDRIAPPGLDERLVDTSPELDIERLDPDPGPSARALTHAARFVVDEAGQAFDLATLVPSGERPSAITILAGPGRVDADLTYVPESAPGTRAVVVSLAFSDGHVERGAFVVETGPVLDPARFVRGAIFAFTGDLEALGHSSAFKRPVHELLFTGGTKSRLAMTLLLMAPALALAVVIALPLGVLVALRRRSRLAAWVRASSTLFLSAPAYLVGALALVVFAERLHLLPSGGAATPSLEGPMSAILVDRALHLVLPVTVLAMGIAARLVRHVEAAMSEVLARPFLDAARARGLSERVVIGKHALVTAAPTIVTAIALYLPALVGGALLTETVFAWPGLGRLQYDAVIANDSYLAMITFLVEAALVLLASLVSDLVALAIDPRIRSAR